MAENSSDFMQGNGSNYSEGSCAARTTEGSVELPFPPLVLIITSSVLLGYYILTCLSGTFFNSAILFLVCKFKKLRTLPFFFAAQIAVINLLGALNHLLSAINAATQEWYLGEEMCIVVGFFQSLLNLLRVVVMLSFVIDRCFTVFLPFLYPKIRTKTLVCLTVGAYLLAIIALVISAGFSCFGFSAMTFNCTISSTCSDACEIVTQFIGIFIYFPVNVLSLILYIILFWKAKKIKNGTVPTANDLANDPETKKREWRATFTFFLMFLALFIVFIPPGLTLIICTSIDASPYEILSVYIVHAVALNLFKLSYTTDALFILWNRDMREVISELCGCCPGNDDDNNIVNININNINNNNNNNQQTVNN